MNTIKTITVTLLALASIACLAKAQSKIDDNFVRQLSVYPQEKLYVLNDKPQYIAGEDVWFRAFLVDNISLLADTTSRYVYGELISPHDSVLCRVKIHPENGAYSGYITIPEATPAGVYELCFHTKYMENLGEDYFFRRQILVGAPFSGMYRMDSKFFYEDDSPKVTAEIRVVPVSGGETLIPDEVRVKDRNGNLMKVNLVDGNTVRLKLDPKKEIRNNALYVEYDFEGKTHKEFIPVPADERSYDVSFFPEGGHLLSGTLSQVAFKALKPNGLGEVVTGYILNSGNDTVSRIESNSLGMGSFPLKVNTGETYTAVCKNGKGIEKRFTLPAAVENTFSLQVKISGGNLNVKVMAPQETAVPAGTATKPNGTALSEGTTSDNQSTPLPAGMRLFVQCRGVPVYNEVINTSNPLVSFDRLGLPDGILHILLIDADLNPVSERLVFNLNDEYKANTGIKTDKANYGRRELVTAKVKITDNNGDPLHGSFAVAVTDDNDVRPDSTNNIVSEFLLASELKGYIENPAYYFENNNRMADLDYLLLTQGWSRYDIPAVIKGNITEPKIQIETGPGISGYVQEGWSGKPAVDGTVLIMSMDSIPYYETVMTDSQGRFMFNNFDLPDSTKYIIQATNKKGKKGTYELTLDKKPLAKVTRRLPWEPISVKEDKAAIEDYMQKAEKRFTDEHGMRTINIKEIVVVTKRPERVAMSYSVYSSPFNDVVRGEDYPDLYSTKKLVSNLPYVHYQGEYLSPIIMARGMQGSPLVIIDGVRTDAGHLYDLPPYLIDEVELVVGPRMALFGLEGLNWAGAFIVTTKKFKDRPNELSMNMKTTTPWGYQAKKEFYSPVYETTEQFNDLKPDMRTTVYWNPDITSDENGNAEIKFYSADTPTTYSVVMEGTTDSGRPMYKTYKILRER